MGGPCGNITWGEVEDYVINIVPPTPCSTTPGANTVAVTSAVICPNTSTPLSLVNTYTLGNIGYQWSYSTNGALGPYTVIPTASTTAALASPVLSVTSWFQLSTWCANGGSTLTTAAAQVSVSPVITSVVPYFEGFEGITVANQLPNCSWSSTGPANAQTYISANVNNRIPRTGNNFASFYYTPAGTRYFYTNGIQLHAGVTYSASMFFTTEYFGYNTYNLSIMLGTTQTTTGLVTIANNSMAASPIYKELANTFSVASSGLYYVAIKAISNGVCCGYYLSWDDLSITIPCNLNSPSLSLTGTTASSVCEGQAVNLTVMGADSYTWNTGVNTSTMSDVPSGNTSYVATGVNTLTGCMSTITKNIVVKPSPNVSILVFNPNVCEGEAITLNATGAANYTWSNGAFGSNMTTSPTSSTTYSVVGSNLFGCVGMSTQFINLNPAPSVAASNVPSVSCIGQNIIFTGSGASTYTWTSNSLFAVGSQVFVQSPAQSTVYNVTGTDANGCSKMISFTQQVETCTGINGQAAAFANLSIYPNPGNGVFNIELPNGLNKTIEITDVSGRTILTENTMQDLIGINISAFSNGIYYLKIKSDHKTEVLKVIKQ